MSIIYICEIGMSEIANNHIETYLSECKDFDKLISNDQHQNIYFWVIDMQNDFIDSPFKDDTLFTEKNNIIKNVEDPNDEGYIPLDDPDGNIRLVPAPIKKLEGRIWNNYDDDKTIFIGRFAVDEGTQCITDIQNYLTKLKENANDKLKKVVFSRDIHTNNISEINHCSFKITSGKGTIDGIGFPAHCVNGTNGCMLNPEIQTMCEKLGDKATVVMKGCNEKTDSFGAYPYNCAEGNAKLYTKLRQHNDCQHSCDDANENGFLKETGSVILNDDEKFLQEVLTKERKSITTLFEGTGEGDLHLICGLAGDYCVRDTAVNLKFAFPKSTVAVIADAVRYPALAEGAIGVMSMLKPEIHGNEEKIKEEIENKRKQLEKELHLKSFIDENAGNKYFITPADTLLYTYSSKFLDNDGVIFTIDNKNKEELKGKLNKVKGKDNDQRPTRDYTDNYWCLARYMYLMGKQLDYSKNNISEGGIQPFSNAIGINKASIGTEKVSTQMALNYGIPVTSQNDTPVVSVNKNKTPNYMLGTTSSNAKITSNPSITNNVNKPWLGGKRNKTSKKSKATKKSKKSKKSSTRKHKKTHKSKH